MPRLILCLVALTLVALVPGCSQQAPVSDAGDGPVVILDAGADRGPGDGAADLTPDAAADLGPDALPDAFLDDLPPPDAVGWDALPTKGTVLYTVTQSSSAFGLRTVGSQGSGSPTLVSGYKGPLSLETLSLAGYREAVPVSPDVPRAMSQMLSGYRGILLPNKGGELYYAHDQSSGSSSLLHVSPAGTLSRIVQAPGLYADTLSKVIALSDDGTLGALVAGGDEVWLFRTDGATFTSSGKAWADVTPTLGGSTLKSVEPRSLLLAGSSLFCKGTDATGQDHLFRGPLDGSARLAALSLPQSAGKTPKVIARQFVKNAAQTHLLVTAGELTSLQDVYLVTVATGSVSKISAAPGYLGSRGDAFGALSGGIALSPKATRLAYSRYVNGSPELFVVEAKAGAKEVEVTTDARFGGGLLAIQNLHFADETNLIFTAGQSSYNLDLYHWDQASSRLTNFTRSGKSTTPPFAGDGELTPRGAWISGDGSWLYLLLYHYEDGYTDIAGVNLKTFAFSQVTRKADVETSAGSFALCPGKNTVYFVAAPNAVHQRREVWAFDQTRGGPAAPLTRLFRHFAAQIYVNDLTLDPSCSRLSWAAGGGYWVQDIWTLDLSSSGAQERKVTKLSRYISPSLRYTPDGTSLVYASGGSQTASLLRAVPLSGGVEKTLDPSGGEIHIFAVGP